ncbi:MAG: hypothetical protein R3A44_05945 [Caldilineaceae bacterium]
MRIITITFGLFATMLAGYYYAVTGATSILHLFPALLGLLIVLMGLQQGRWAHLRPLYGAVMLAILVAVGALRTGLAWYRDGGTEVTTSLYVRIAMGLLALIFIVITVIRTADFWTGWKAFGHFLGNWLARGVLTIFYFTIFVPFGIASRWFSDPLHIRTTPDRLWQDRTTGDQTLEKAGRQY